MQQAYGKRADPNRKSELPWPLKFALISSLLFIPTQAFAVDAIGQLMCNAVQLMAGTTGKAICTINVIAVGVGALVGKISWNKAMVVVMGVGLVFGGAGIVSSLSGMTELQYGTALGTGGTGGTGTGGVSANGTGTGGTGGTGVGTGGTGTSGTGGVSANGTGTGVGTGGKELPAPVFGIGGNSCSASKSITTSETALLPSGALSR